MVGIKYIFNDISINFVTTLYYIKMRHQPNCTTCTVVLCIKQECSAQFLILNYLSCVYFIVFLKHFFKYDILINFNCIY